MQTIPSPVGPLYLAADSTALRAVIFENGWSEFQSQNPHLKKQSNKITTQAATQLAEYFCGRRKKFDVPYVLEGTQFQTKVWSTLGKIPYGSTFTYKQQAELVGNPNAVRAVGGTNGRNPLAIILPCHRVIGSSGKLTGYAGGLEKKKFLLTLEGIELTSN